jgi:uncharacterized protein (DUF433 family)
LTLKNARLTIANMSRAPNIKGYDRVTIDPNQMNGQPCVRNMRLTVRRVLEAMATYPRREDLFREFPELEEEDLRQVLAFAAANISDEALDFQVA